MEEVDNNIQNHQERINALQAQIDFAVREQENARVRVDVLRAEARRMRTNANQSFGRSSSNSSFRRDSSLLRTPIIDRATERDEYDDDLSYAERSSEGSADNALKQARDELFRARSADESTVTYARRVDAQARYRARERYVEGARQRDASALHKWYAAEEREHRSQARNGAHELTPRRGGGNAPGGGGPEGPPSDSDPEDGPPPGPGRNRPGGNHHNGRRGGDGGGNDGAGGRGNGPPGGPPGRGPPGGGDGSSDSEREDGGRRHRAGPIGRDRTPNYLEDGEGPLEIVDHGHDPEASYLRAQLEEVRRIIRERLAFEAPETPGLKNLKNTLPSTPYDGKDDALGFIAWLKALLRWLYLSRLTSAEADPIRVDIMGQCTTGPAQTWFNEVVDDHRGAGRNWTFEQVVCAMYKRFIHHSTARRAAEEFKSAKWTEAGGVAGLWDELLRCALRMPVAPDEYTFNRRFADALPEQLGTTLFLTRPVSTETTSPRALRDAALAVENSLRTAREYKAHRPGAHDLDKREVRDKSDARKSSNDRQKHRGSNAMSQPPRFSQGGYRTPVASREGTSYRPGNRPFPRQTEAPRAPNTNVPTREAKPGTSAPGNNPAPERKDIKCYACGGMGHMANSCPQKGGPNLRAARVVDDRSDDEKGEDSSPKHVDELAAPTAVDTPPDATQPWAGEEEYDEAQDGFEGSQYDPWENEEEGVDGGEDDTTVWFGGMRIRTHDAEPEPQDQNVPQGPWSQFYWDMMEPVPQGGLIPPAELENNGNIARGPSDDELDDVPELEDWGPVNVEVPAPRSLTMRSTVGQVHAYHRWAEREGERLWDEFERWVGQNGEATALRNHYTRVMQAGQTMANIVRSQWDSLELQRAEAGMYALQISRTLAREREAFAGMDRVEWTRRSNEQRDFLYHRAVSRHRGGTPSDPAETLIAVYQDDRLLLRGIDPVAEETNHRLEEEAPREGEGTNNAGNNENENNDSRVNLHAMRIMSMRAPAQTVTSTPTVVTRARSGRRPLLPKHDQACLTAYININGLKALVLFDSGSTTDSLSPDFAAVAKAPKFELENPAVLQLGCVGSRSRINYGTKVPVVIGQFTNDVYFDIVNLDRYDAVLGTPFMRKYGVRLDFSNGAVQLANEKIATLTPEDEEAAAARRNPRTGHRSAQWAPTSN